MKWYDGVWSRFKPGLGKDKRGVSGVDKKTIVETGKKISEIPNNFVVHKTLRKIFEQRKKMFTENSPIDWSTAELLAFGTLLTDGFSVRLSGQDSGRGTFSQRHSVLRHQENHDRYIPLNNLAKKQKKFEIIDSLLSELAVLGFEFDILCQNRDPSYLGSSIWRFCKWSSGYNRSIYHIRRDKMGES